MNKTAIEWTDFSSTPLRYRDAAGRVVWACVHASPGCINCYAEALAHRFNKGADFTVPNMATLTPFLDAKEMRTLLTAKKIAGAKVFLNDMTDLFGEWVPDALLDQMFAMMALRPDVTFQILTKRANRMRAYMESRSKSSTHWKNAARTIGYSLEFEGVSLVTFPLLNVWLGVSAEDQPRYDERVGHLLRTPAAVRFWSLEPLLGPIDMRMGGNSLPDYSPHNPLPQVDWVIVGGESGPQARPCDIEWIRGIVRQCRAAGTACFVKQLGSRPIAPGHCDESDIHIQGKGGDWSQWPIELRVREFPRAHERQI